MWLPLPQFHHATLGLCVTGGIIAVTDDPDGRHYLLRIDAEYDTPIPVPDDDLTPVSQAPAERLTRLLPYLLQTDQLLQEERQIARFSVANKIRDSFIDELDSERHLLGEVAELLASIPELREGLIK